MGEGHIPQLGSGYALLPGGVSRFFLISFPRVPISQIKALSLPSFVLHQNSSVSTGNLRRGEEEVKLKCHASCLCSDETLGRVKLQTDAG